MHTIYIGYQDSPNARTPVPVMRTICLTDIGYQDGPYARTPCSCLSAAGPKKRSEQGTTAAFTTLPHSPAPMGDEQACPGTGYTAANRGRVQVPARHMHRTSTQQRVRLLP